LDDAFLAELQQAFNRIQDAPESFSSLEGYSGPLELRRCMLKRFPYLVAFVNRSDEVVVAAISHVRRRPLYWLTRVE
jgi:plasmid stabilization system protein ParE